MTPSDLAPIVAHPAARDAEARKAVERFRSAALTHLLDLSLTHGRCRRDVCLVCEHAVRVNDMLNGGA